MVREKKVMLATHLELPASEIAAFCERHHIRRLSFFGSVLREDFDSTSDVDVLIEFEEGHGGGFFEFISMQIELSEIIGRQVDLNTLEDLSRYFRQQVIDSAEVQDERR
jgi:hypothetical protein